MTEQVDVIVLGAGPSGLAVSACLKRRGVAPVILERAGQVGSSWRNHYERLHLHTVKQFSSLPGMPWPEDVAMYPSRQDVVDYLDAYARRFGLAPRFHQDVKRVSDRDGRWVVETQTGALHARAIVVATGYNRVPRAVTWPGLEDFTGTVAHSSDYRNGRAWKGQRVLVVGAGNSGAEIALDLWESGAIASLCVRSPIHVIPREVLGVPAQINSLFLMGRLPRPVADRVSRALLDRVVGDLSRWGIRRPDEGPVTQVVTRGRIPLIDIGTVSLIKQGKITVYPGIRRFTRDAVVFEDGRAQRFDHVVLATGYRAGLDAIFEGSERFLDARGYPRWHGTEGPVPGVYFIGYRNPLTGALHDIAREAERVAAKIARRGR